jgi:transcriptional regulator with XRE-family HTH domain
MQEETVGSRICSARRAAGLSQRELAARITAADRVDGLSPSALSRIESGHRRVASRELAELADVLSVTVDDLLGTRQRSAALVLAARVTQAAPADYRMVAERARQILEADDLLGWIVSAGAPLSMPPIPHEDLPVTRAGGHELAKRAREALGLGHGPIGDLTAIIEEHLGANVLVEPLPPGVHGFCAVYPSAGALPAAAVIIVNGDDVLGRQRFTLAHELCHLLTGDPVELEVLSKQREKSPAENRADAFAVAFLAPEEGVRQAVGSHRFDEALIRRMSRLFGMSHQAMTRRLEEVGLARFLSRDHARDVALRASLLAENGEETVRRRAPVRLLERALLAYDEGRIGIGLIADILGDADTVGLAERLQADGYEPPEPVPDA